MDCKILEIEDKEGLITSAKYLCTLNNIQTEGWWIFGDPVLNKPITEVVEADVIGWIMAEAGELIKKNLTAQFENTQKPKSIAPWLPQTFTPSI